MDAAQRGERDGILPPADQPGGRTRQSGRDLTAEGRPAPIIVAALLAPADQAFFDRLRQMHFPPERNYLSAHLTMFHHLPPSIAAELHALLRSETRHVTAPAAVASGLMSLGRGVAYRIESAGLATLRARLADAFAGLLAPQDQAGWRPHITIQNKVEPAVARTLLHDLQRGFAPRRLSVTGIGTWWYRGGPWEPLAMHRFTP